MNEYHPEPRASTRAAIATAIAVLLLATSGMAGASGPDGRVRGYVTDASTSLPVPGATVRIEASDLPWTFDATTDATGYYAVALPPHQYSLSAWSPAHMTNTTSVGVGSGRTTWLNVTLSAAPARTGRIQGYVTDSVSGAPVATGRVAAAPSFGFGSTYRNASALDAAGYYRIALVPDWYDLATENVTGYHAYTASSIWVRSGDVLWRNFTMDPSPVDAWLNGTVRDANTNAPIAGAHVTARVDGITFPPATTDGTGAYSVHVQEGSAEVVADAAGYAPGSTTTYISGPGTWYAYLSLPPLSHSVRGYVRNGVTRGPLPGTLVTASPVFSTGYYDDASADASGYYEIAIPEDDYVLAAQAPGFTTWTSYLFYFPSTVVWQNVTLWPIVSTVQGYLVDALDSSHIAGLNMVGLDLRTSYSKTTVSDAMGFYRFSFPPSPAITVAVYGQGVYAGDIAYVGTRPYATTWLNITVPRLSAQIDATVTDANTALPISGATVNVGWTYGSGSATTNATGDARLDAPAGATTYVTAWATGYLTSSVQLSPVPGPNPVPIALFPDLPADVRVRGYVNDTSGAPVWSVQVKATGYGGSTPSDYTDSSGYYELMIVAAPQRIQAYDSGYARAEVAVDPSPGETVWANMTLVEDHVAPSVLSFTATPSTGVSVSRPAALAGDVREANFDHADISPLMLYSTSLGIGTFLNLGPLPAADVTVASPSAGNWTVSSSWDTRSPIGRFSDGTNTLWWPVLTVYGLYLGATTGYFDNATLTSPVATTAVFDIRDGRLLYILVAGSEFVDPRDQPSATFAPVASGLRVNLSTGAIVGWSIVTAPALLVGGLGLTYSPSVPGGQYAALLEAWDSANGYGSAVALMDTGPDTVPPVANAGPDVTVDQGATVAFDGSGSTDNLGVASWRWTFTDGTPQSLSGRTATYVFGNAGTFVVTLTVTDADGNSDTDTLTVTVRDTTDPTVSILVPTEGATVSGSVPVTVAATDNVGVARVEFILDGTSLGSDTSAPFETIVPAASMTIGNHTIEVTAYDAAGNSANDTRHVTVVATPPGGGGPVVSTDLLPYLILILVAAIAAAAVALLLVRRRKQKRPEAPALETPPQGPPQ